MAYRGSSFGGFGGFGMTPWVGRLLIANIVVFLLQNVIPSLTMQLAFIPALTLVRPWTMITYMFAHGGFGHLLFNMIALFFFGPPLEDRLGSRGFLIFWLVSGLGGAALSFAFAYDAPIIGASAGVYGVLLAFAMFYPDMPIYIWGILPVKAKYLVAVLAVFSILSMMQPTGGNIAHAAHLGGFAAGFLYLKLGSPGGGVGGLKRMLNKRKLRVVTYDDHSRKAAPPTSRGPSPRRRAASGEEEKLLDELDRVLEKISTQGMSSLTSEERKLLDEVSRRYRTD